jgi:hypothetical protein
MLLKHGVLVNLLVASDSFDEQGREKRASSYAAFEREQGG